MPLTKKDKEDIGQIVETKVSKEIGFLRLEMNQRFDEAAIQNKKEHQEILEKIEEVKQMENEGILALAGDLEKVKKKVGV